MLIRENNVVMNVLKNIAVQISICTDRITPADIAKFSNHQN